VGVDRGEAVSAALSTGDRLRVPGLSWREKTRLRRLERKLARAKRGSARRGQVRLAIARLRARGGFRGAGPANREPHLLTSLTGSE
jgi:putative transposase